jgi:hypothetical protein
LYVLLWAEGLTAKDIHKEMFPVYDGKCLSRKAVHSWVEEHGKRFADDEEIETKMRKWMKRQSKDFCSAGFDAFAKAMGQVYQFWWRICRKTNVLPYMSEYHMFYYVLYPIVTYLLTLPPSTTCVWVSLDNSYNYE